VHHSYFSVTHYSRNFFVLNVAYSFRCAKINTILWRHKQCLYCFDIVGWASGRASSL